MHLRSPWILVVAACTGSIYAQAQTNRSAVTLPSTAATVPATQVIPATHPAQDVAIVTTFLGDLNTAPVKRLTVNNQIQLLVQDEDRAIFSKADSSTGRELWFSDGTRAGTHLITDLEPGEGSSDPLDLTPIGQGLFTFTATVGHSGRRLYVTDGSSEGTRLLLDARPESTTERYERFLRVGDRAFFVVPVDDESLYSGDPNFTGDLDLWVTDGTPQGTSLVRRLPAARNVKSVFEFRGKFCLQHTGSREVIWISDGTPQGTTAVSYTMWGTPVATNNYLWFAGPGGSLNRVDASLGAAIAVESGVGAEGIAADSQAPTIALGDFLLYAPKQHWALFATQDGKPATTRLLTKKYKMIHVFMPRVIGSKAYFQASPPPRKIKRDGKEIDAWPSPEMYVTDGTPEGTYLLPHSGRPLGSVGKGVLYATYSDAKVDLSYSESDAKPLRTIFSVPNGKREVQFTEATQTGGGLLFFACKDKQSETLFCSDGTPQGTLQLTDAEPDATDDSNPTFVRLPSGRFIGAAQTATLGYELFVSDGTAQGTELVETVKGKLSGLEAPPIINDLPARARFVVCGELAYFVVRLPAAGVTLWSSDGTKDGTKLVAKLTPAKDSDAHLPSVLYAGTRSVYIDVTNTNSTRSLFRFDTMNQTLSREWDEPVPVVPKNPGNAPPRPPGPGRPVPPAIQNPAGPDGSPNRRRNLQQTSGAKAAIWGDRLLTSRRSSPESVAIVISGPNPGDQTSIIQDGLRVEPFAVPFLSAEQSRQSKKCFYFASGSHGISLWESDGTVANTVEVGSLKERAWGSLFYEALHAQENSILCRVSDFVVSGVEQKYMPCDLVHIDVSTKKVTWLGANEDPERQVKADFVQATNLTFDGRYTYFFATRSDGLRCLYSSDGTPQGTRHLRTLGTPSASFGTVETIVRHGGVILFSTPTGEICRTDGTPEGTQIDENLTSQFRGLRARLIQLDASHAMVVAKSLRYGVEPWVIDPNYRPQIARSVTTLPTSAPTTQATTSASPSTTTSAPAAK